MKAAFFRAHGGPEVLEVGELAAPEVQPGQVKVRVRAAALNHIDLWLRRGLPKLPVPLPHVCGADVSGEVAELGAGVTGFAVGDKVVINPGLSCGRCVHCHAGRDHLCARYGLLGESTWGGEAEFVCVPPVNLVPAPAGVDHERLCALPVAYMTAWQMLTGRAAVRPGETVFVWAAGSGVGTAAVQLAKMLGARVLASASSADKARLARELGADHVIETQSGALDAVAIGKEVKRLTAGEGADVVIEHIGVATIGASIRMAARGGRIVTCGATSGAAAELDLRHIFWRQLSLLGSTMAPRSALFDIVRMVADGRLAPVVDRVLPLEQIAEAHRVLESRVALGKIVLRVSAG